MSANAVSMRVMPRRRGGFYAVAEGADLPAQRAAVRHMRDLLRERGVPAESYVVVSDRLAVQGYSALAPLATADDLPAIAEAAAEVTLAAHAAQARSTMP